MDEPLALRNVPRGPLNPVTTAALPDIPGLQRTNEPNINAQLKILHVGFPWTPQRQPYLNNKCLAMIVNGKQ